MLEKFVDTLGEKVKAVIAVDPLSEVNKNCRHV